MFPSSPGYATDQQLSMMAKGGIPQAINEEITRLALRRGAKAVPQQPVAPSPQAMSGEEMINDFVRRVRQENANNAQSIVPAGTPQQSATVQPPQPQPAPQAGGIAAFSSGGAWMPHLRGFQDGGGPRPRLERDQAYDWLPGGDPPLQAATGPVMPNVRPRPFMPSAGSRPTGIFTSEDEVWKDPYLDSMSREEIEKQNAIARQARGIAAHRNKLNASAKDWYNSRASSMPQQQTEMPPEVDTAGGGSAGLAALMSDFPSVGDFSPSEMLPAPEYKAASIEDIEAAGQSMVDKNRGRIDALKEPYMEGAGLLEGDLEESKRNQVFKALINGGAAAMDAAGAGFDPRNGDFMSAMSRLISTYAESIESSKEYQQKIKDKIVAYKGMANELDFNAENALFGRGADIQQNQNNQNIMASGYENQFNSSVYGARQSALVAQDNMRLQARGQDMQADLARAEAKLKIAISSSTGLDPEIAEKIANNGAQAYAKGRDGYLSSVGFDSIQDEAERERVLKRAQAQGIGLQAAYLSDINRMMLGGRLGDIKKITEMVQSMHMGAAGEEVDREGTTSFNSPYAPSLESGAPDIGEYLSRMGAIGP